MVDQPDWVRMFHLVGTTITIPINIESSDITLDVNLVGSDIQMDVNIAAAAVTLDFNFADQSVAVFDAAKWFAHQAQQWGINGNANVNDGGSATVASRTVPAGKVAFVSGFSGAIFPNFDASVITFLSIGGVLVTVIGAQRGESISLDTPMRGTAGQVIAVIASQVSGDVRQCYGGAWGYDEAA